MTDLLVIAPKSTATRKGRSTMKNLHLKFIEGDPPPKAVGRRRSKGERLASRLRSNRGKWAHLGRMKNGNTVKMWKGIRGEADIEVVQRNIEGAYSDVYVRALILVEESE